MFDRTAFTTAVADFDVSLPPAGRVGVAMSGGVDSTVVAALAATAGLDVVGVTMLLWGGERNHRSCSTADASAAANAAAAVGVEHVVVDLRDVFNTEVLDTFVAGVAAGDTPNPCIACNRSAKLAFLSTWMADNDIDWLLTGHHAQVVDSPNGRLLARSVDVHKDQSYVLYTADRDMLSHLWLPLGSLNKDEVRALARAGRLDVADVADSMDLCFDPGTVLAASGVVYDAEVVTVDGTVLGVLPASVPVTLGQHRKLGVNTFGQPVIDIDRVSAKITVGEASLLLRTETTLVAVHTVASLRVGDGLFAQFSAHGTPHPVTVVSFDAETMVVSHSELSATASGQHVVLYDASLVTGVDAVVAGGVIERR